MTPRGVRLMVAAAVLAWGAAALATVPDQLPAGLARAVAPGRVLPELLAGLAVWVLLIVPAALAAEPAPEGSDPVPFACVLAGAPPALALALADGLEAAVMAPAFALLCASAAAAAAWRRFDPEGQRAGRAVGGALLLLVAGPIAGYGLVELGGLDGARILFRMSPLLAARAVDGGWAAQGPASLLLVALAAVLALVPRRCATKTPGVIA